MFDIITSILILAFGPFILLFSKIPIKLINNSIKVLLGLKTWIGYYKNSNIRIDNLPKIKDGVLTPLDLRTINESDNSFINKSNMVYAKNYTIWNDFNILLKGFKWIGR